MATNTIMYSGKFTSTGANVFLPFRGGVSWIRTLNQTVVNTGGAHVGTGALFNWDNTMPNGQGYSWTNVAAAPLYAQLAANTGFFFQDTSFVAYTFNNPVNPITDISAAGLVSAVAHGLPNGAIVRFTNVVGTASVLGAIDWIVTTIGGANDADHFTITNPPANLVHDAAPGANAGFVMLSREGLFVPEDRVIVSISQAAQAVITFAAPHEFLVGNDVRINVNPITNAQVYSYLKSTYGSSPSLNPQATVVAVNSNVSITVNLNTVAMPPFAFPLQAAGAFGPSQVTPIGQDTAFSLVANVNILGDQPIGPGNGPNIGQIGMLLVGGGVNNPAGVNGNVISWEAGITFNNY